MTVTYTPNDTPVARQIETLNDAIELVRSQIGPKTTDNSKVYDLYMIDEREEPIHINQMPWDICIDFLKADFERWQTDITAPLPHYLVSPMTNDDNETEWAIGFGEDAATWLVDNADDPFFCATLSPTQFEELTPISAPVTE